MARSEASKRRKAKQRKLENKSICKNCFYHKVIKYVGPRCIRDKEDRKYYQVSENDTCPYFKSKEKKL